MFYHFNGIQTFPLDVRECWPFIKIQKETDEKWTYIPKGSGLSIAIFFKKKHVQFRTSQMMIPIIKYVTSLKWKYASS